MIAPSPLTEWPHEEGGGEHRKKPLEANDGREESGQIPGEPHSGEDIFGSV